MKKNILLVVLLATFIVPEWCAGQNVQVDFSVYAGPPLVKTKFGVYQTPLTSTDRLVADLYRLNELGARTMRYETAWGKDIAFNYPQITGSPGNLNYNRTDYTRFLKELKDQNAHPLLTQGYNPLPFIEPGKDWRSKPNDLSAWQRINRDYARHWRDAGIERVSYEIWNEPDLSIFSTFPQSDYFQLYNTGARGVRAGDPDAKVGGPVTALPGWHEDFLRYVRGRSLPIDFLSGHAYGFPEGQIQSMQSALGANDWPTVEMYLTEYASYGTNRPDDGRPGGVIQRHDAAADFLEDAKYFLGYTALTRVYWAQWSDLTFFRQDGSYYVPDNVDKTGFIDAEGNVRAIYNAFKVYNEMPVDRNGITVSASDLDAMASSGPYNAGVVIWNEQQQGRTNASVQMDNLPFESGTAELYRIDAHNSSIFENEANPELSVIDTFPVEDASLTWNGSIPGKGVVFLKLSDESGQSELEPHPVADVIRTHRWFWDRGNTHYGNFDAETWIVRLGTGAAKDYADALVGATIEKIPVALDVSISTTGALEDLDENSMLGVRIDYQGLGGKYIKSVLYHGDLYHADRTSEGHFGKAGRADETVAVDDLSAFTIDVAGRAPDDFRGRAILSFRLQNTGKNTRAKIKVRKGSEKTIPVEDLDTAIEENPNLPQQFDLGDNYPNPFQRSSTITYALPQAASVRLAIYDLLGRRVTILVDEQKPAGSYDVQFEASNLSSGVYFYRLQAGDFSEMKKMIVVQ